MATKAPSGDELNVDEYIGIVRRPETGYHWADYLVFTMTLVVSSIIGLYFGIKARSRMTIRELLLGGKNLNLYSVALSLVATVTSTLFVLGVPSRTYFGGEWPLYVALSFIPATVITVHVFIPIFHKLGVTSAYEYLGIRFNNIIRFMTAVDFIIMMNLTQALTIYSPAVGFALVAGVSLEVSILAAGLVCTFYTALGGLRAVVVTDIFQISTVIIGILGLFIKGAVDAGGIDKVFSKIGDSYRLKLWSIHWTKGGTYTFWSQVLGGSVIFLGLFAANQTTVQRYCSVKECRDAQKAAYIALCLYIVIWILVLLLGLVIYSFYYTCDPLVLQIIDSPDQILPLFVMDTLGHLHGLPGLFSAVVFSAVLSSVSSGINSLAAVTLEDIIKPIYYRRNKKELSDYYCRSLATTLALFYGLLSIGLSYIPVKYGTYILNLDMTFSAYGVLGGPVIGVFVLGTMFPLANSLGTGVGLLIGTLFGIWIWLGRLLCKNSSFPDVKFPQPTECSALYNLTGYDPMADPPTSGFPGEKIYVDCPLQPMYDVSYLWYGLIGSGITIAVGLLASMISGGHGAKRVSPDLLCWDRAIRGWKNLIAKITKRKTEEFVPTIEGGSQTIPTPQPPSPTTKTADNKPAADIKPPREEILLLKTPFKTEAAPPNGATYDPHDVIPCYLEEDTQNPESTERVLYQDSEPLPTIDGILAFDQTHAGDGVLYPGEHVNPGYIPEDPDYNIRVLHRPNEYDQAVVADSIVLRPGSNLSPEGVLYAPPSADLSGDGVLTSGDVLHSGSYPDTSDNFPDQTVLYGDTVPYEDPVLHANPVVHTTTDSQLVQRHNASRVPTLWS